MCPRLDLAVFGRPSVALDSNLLGSLFPTDRVAPTSKSKEFELTVGVVSFLYRARQMEKGGTWLTNLSRYQG